MGEFDPIAYINEPRWQESRLGLERITVLLDRMGRPQDRLKFVHVAGTNGKGSTCAFLSQILQCAGYRTGMFTSPFIIEFEERIRVNGQNISKDDLMSVTMFVREHAEALYEETGEHPTEFELMTAVAFEHFARSECDIVVCEVGMGGRLDSTNVIENPEACIIVRLGLDHMAFLGDTPQAVAREKAGIIKDGAPVISWPQDDPTVMKVVADRAAECGGPLVVPDYSELQVGHVGPSGLRPFTWQGVQFETRLLGSYQPYNAVLAIEAARVLASKGWKIDEDTIREGISRTVWPGRFELVKAGPPAVVVDGGHNPQGVSVLAQSLRDVFPDKDIVFVMSVMADKDYIPMIREVLPLAKAFACFTSPNPRALHAPELASVIAYEAEAMSLPVEAHAFDSVDEAVAWALESGDADVICAFGSLYSISEIRRALKL